MNEELKELEQIVGLQTDRPLKRAFMRMWNRMSEEACTTYGYNTKRKAARDLYKYHKTHNDAVFSAYTPEMRFSAEK
ncbi:pyruvate formate lyase family protein [Dubosiella newyorkensis]|uniref:pyruvate formate lyase family protein n=1 Tax=Dubosiella newyorkensis TaxID=1862672 RepID=UPI003F665EBB